MAFQIARVFDLPLDDVFHYPRSERDTPRRPWSKTITVRATCFISSTSTSQPPACAGRLIAGQQVLVIGAAGGVGLFAVQLAQQLGGVVTGVSSTAKIELVTSLGADAAIDYTRGDLGSERYDLILDLAANRTISLLRRSLTATGTLVIVGGEGSGRIPGASSALSGRWWSPSSCGSG